MGIREMREREGGREGKRQRERQRETERERERERERETTCDNLILYKYEERKNTTT